MTTTAQPQVPDILSAEFAADPYAAYRIMREHYPLIHHEATRSYIVSRYDDVQRAFKEPVFTTDNYDWQLEPVHGRTIRPSCEGTTGFSRWGNRIPGAGAAQRRSTLRCQWRAVA